MQIKLKLILRVENQKLVCKKQSDTKFRVENISYVSNKKI